MIDSILHSRMHDLNGDGQWTDDELKALFQKQLDEVYDPNNKVWPLPQLIPNSFFVKKIIDLPGVAGNLNDDSSGYGYCSLSFIPATPLSHTIEGLFELSKRSARTLPQALLPELQRNKDTVRCSTPVEEVDTVRYI